MMCMMLGLVSLGVVLWAWCGSAGGAGQRQVRLVAMLVGFALGMGIVMVAGDAVLLFCMLRVCTDWCNAPIAHCSVR